MSRPIQGGDGERCGLRSAKVDLDARGRQPSTPTWRIPRGAVIRMRWPQTASAKSAPRRGRLLRHCQELRRHSRWIRTDPEGLSVVPGGSRGDALMLAVTAPGRWGGQPAKRLTCQTWALEFVTDGDSPMVAGHARSADLDVLRAAKIVVHGLLPGAVQDQHRAFADCDGRPGALPTSATRATRRPGGCPGQEAGGLFDAGGRPGRAEAVPTGPRDRLGKSQCRKGDLEIHCTWLEGPSPCASSPRGEAAFAPGTAASSGRPAPSRS